MWQGQDKVWLQFRRDILATDIPSGTFLADYLRHIGIHNLHANYLEIVDLQKYKVIRTPNKIRAALRDRAFVPFIFVVGRN